MRQIAKKRSVLEQITGLQRLVGQRLSEAGAAFGGRYNAVGTEIRLLLEGLLGPGSGLNKKVRARIRRAYGDLLATLPDGLTPREAEDSVSAHRGRQGATDSDSAGVSPGAHTPGPERSLLLRACFRRLAVVLHPDKVQDDALRLERTALMKEVTRAYDTADLARLFELESVWLSGEAHAADLGSMSQRVADAALANRALRGQLRQLTHAYKQARAALPFELDLRLNATTAERVERSLSELLAAARRELDRLEELRDFVVTFRAGDMSLDAFLLGPRPGEMRVASSDATLRG